MSASKFRQNYKIKL